MSQALVRWVTDKQFVAESGSGHAMVLDAGSAVGGRNTGATPMELILIGLAGCTGMDIVHILQGKMKRQLTHLEVEVSGERAAEAPKVYTEIAVLYRLSGRELPTKDAIRAIRLSAEKYCSVSKMLEKTATIRSRYELIDDLSGEIVSGELEAN